MPGSCEKIAGTRLPLSVNATSHVKSPDCPRIFSRLRVRSFRLAAIPLLALALANAWAAQAPPSRLPIPRTPNPPSSQTPPPQNVPGIQIAPGLVIRPTQITLPPQVPFRDETLRYTIARSREGATDVGKGEAQLQAVRNGDRWSFVFSLDASLAGLSASDSLQSVAVGDFCSTDFFKSIHHGPRQASEHTVFNPATSTASRETLGGGRSELKAAPCSRDALNYLYFLRRELTQGRLPAPQTVFFGAPYQVRAEFGGAQPFTIGGQPLEADLVRVDYQGPASKGSVEVFFLRDPARTPVLVRIPLAKLVYSLELVR